VIVVKQERTAAQAARRSLLTDAERRSCKRPGSNPLYQCFSIIMCSTWELRRAFLQQV
jgi:hypothetical protein